MQTLGRRYQKTLFRMHKQTLHADGGFTKHKNKKSTYQFDRDIQSPDSESPPEELKESDIGMGYEMSLKPTNMTIDKLQTRFKRGDEGDLVLDDFLVLNMRDWKEKRAFNCPYRRKDIELQDFLTHLEKEHHMDFINPIQLSGLQSYKYDVILKCTLCKKQLSFMQSKIHTIFCSKSRSGD